MADGVVGRRAHAQLHLRFLVADGAREAGLQGALPVGEGVVHALLAHRVVVVVAVRVHALPRRAHGARLAAAGDPVEEVVVVAGADGVVGVGAGRLQPHQAGALCARLALLRVTVVLREGLACGGSRGRVEGGEERGDGRGEKEQVKEVRTMEGAEDMMRQTVSLTALIVFTAQPSGEGRTH